MALLLAAALVVVGCSSTPAQQDDGTATAQFAISGQDLLQSPTGGASVDRTLSAMAFSYSDVNQVRINIWEKGKPDQPLFVNFDLGQDAAAPSWSGKIPFLPKNKPLTFSATAYKSGTLLFSGSTDQTLTENFQTVPMALAPVNNNATIKLPRILKVLVPNSVTSTQSGSVSFVVEATTGETLTYAITKASNVPGTFAPDTGTITLLGSAGTFVSQYTAPTVTTDTNFEYTVTVTSAAGHSVATTFQIKVKPVGGTDGGKDTNVVVIFNPVINSLTAQRVLGTGNIIWTASVADADLPTTPLTYAWSFDPASTYTPALAFTGNTNPTTLQNYTTSVQGTLHLAVTNSHGGTTTVNYQIIPNQFLDNPIEFQVATGLNSIRGGADHTCVLFNNGNVRCWGLNDKGQLGYGDQITTGAGSTTSFPYPYSRPDVNMVGQGTKLAVGGNHTCVLFDSGFVRCWGLNDHGQLGYKLGVAPVSNPNLYNVGDAEPVYGYGYVNLGGNAVKITAGFEHTCALMDTGKVRCWGHNDKGQLGYGNISDVGDDEAPYQAGDVQVGGTVQDVVAGGYHTCALLDTGDVRCWGLNDNGQLGLGVNTLSDGIIGDNENPSVKPVVSLGGTVTQLAAGKYHTCALMSTGNMRCWGSNANGQLGLGPTFPSNIGDNEQPNTVPTIDVGSKVLQMAADDGHTCALLSTGDVKCWGLNTSGQLGLGNTTSLNKPDPVKVVNLDGNSAFQITTGAQSSCALLSNGKARCWGRNANGQLGLGNTTNVGTTTLVTNDVLLTAP
ncbi:RTX toxin [Hyalangium sp.]|uniref:RCC1 domain-containing protein n=1 Tax=Hyalangium sp. TaxID=2028555 RepID=UPI003899A2C6